GLVDERVDPLLAGLGAGGVEDQHGRTREVPAHLAGVGAELLDDRRVPVGHAAEPTDGPMSSRRGEAGWCGRAAIPSRSRRSSTSHGTWTPPARPDQPASLV